MVQVRGSASRGVAPGGADEVGTRGFYRRSRHVAVWEPTTANVPKAVEESGVRPEAFIRWLALSQVTPSTAFQVDPFHRSSAKVSPFAATWS